MTAFATQSSIQFSAPGLAGRAAAGAGKSKLLTASELRGLLGTGSAGLGTKYLADDSTWKSIDLTGYVPYTGATGAVNLGANGLTVGAITASGLLNLQNSTTPQRLTLHSTYTSGTSYGRLGIIANAGQTAYEISSDKGSAGGVNLPINIGHRDSAGTFTSALSVATTGICTFVASPLFTNDLNFGGGSQLTWSAKSQLRCPGINGTLRLANNTASAGIQFDVTTNGTLRILDLAGTSSGNLTVAAITASGTITGRASTTAAATAPVKLPTGVLMTTPEAGAIEYDGTNLYFTDSGGTRRRLQVV